MINIYRHHNKVVLSFEDGPVLRLSKNQAMELSIALNDCALDIANNAQQSSEFRPVTVKSQNTIFK